MTTDGDRHLRTSDPAWAACCPLTPLARRPLPGTGQADAWIDLPKPDRVHRSRPRNYGTTTFPDPLPTYWEAAYQAYSNAKPPKPPWQTTLVDAIVLPPHMLVLSESGTLAEETVRKSSMLTGGSHGWSARSLERTAGQGRIFEMHLASLGRIAEPAVLLGWGQADNYYHWMIEFVPRLMFCANFLRDRWLLTPPLRQRFHLETLAYFGIDLDRVIQVAEPTRVPHLVLTATPGQSNVRISPTVRMFYREAASSKAVIDQAPTRIYVTRRTAKMRRVVNEDELTPLLARFGIQVIDPGGLSFAEQAALFARAEFIIGPHGAGLTNMVLAPSLRTVVELLPDSFDQGVTSYSALSDVLEVDYHLLFGERRDTNSSARPANVHFTVDLPRLATLLERIL